MIGDKAQYVSIIRAFKTTVVRAHPSSPTLENDDVVNIEIHDKQRIVCYENHLALVPQSADVNIRSLTMLEFATLSSG